MANSNDVTVLDATPQAVLHLVQLKTKRRLKESIDPQRIRGTLNEMIKNQIEEQKGGSAEENAPPPQ